MNVLMVGVGEKRVGGMWTVAREYIQNLYFNQKVFLKYIPTSTNGSLLFRILYMLNGYRKIIYTLLFEKVDIVHIHMAEKGSTFRKGYVVKWSKLFGKKVIIHMHAGPFLQWFYSLTKAKQGSVKKILMLADNILVLGEYWKKELEELIPERKIEVLYNGTKCPDYNAYNIRASNIVYLGVMNSNKGIYDLLTALKQIDSDLDPLVKVKLCGNDLEGDVKKVIEDYGLTERIEMLGWINQSQQIEIFKETMINVLPSYFEGLSMTVIEAMAYGIPVVTTNISTMPELLGKDAYMINPGDIDALGEILLKLSGDSQLRRQISEEEYQRAKHIFSEDAFIKKTIQIYESVLRGE